MATSFNNPKPVLHSDKSLSWPFSNSCLSFADVPSVHWRSVSDSMLFSEQQIRDFMQARRRFATRMEELLRDRAEIQVGQGG